jgi:glycerol kinase
VLCSDADSITYALEGTVNGAGSALSWWQERTGTDISSSFNSLQPSLVDTQSIPLFINAVGGIASPYWLSTQESKFVDDAASTSKQQLIAIIESIAFLLNANIELMHARLPELDSIQLGGGLSACSYLCECLAELSSFKVLRMSERELTGRGLAYLTSSRPHSWSAMKFKQTILPKPNSPLLSRQQKWRAHMQALVGRNKVIGLN